MYPLSAHLEMRTVSTSLQKLTGAILSYRRQGCEVWGQVPGCRPTLSVVSSLEITLRRSNLYRAHRASHFVNRCHDPRLTCRQCSPNLSTKSLVLLDDQVLA